MVIKEREIEENLYDISVKHRVKISIKSPKKINILHFWTREAGERPKSNDFFELRK